MTPDAGGSFVLSSLSPFTMYSYAVAASTVNGTGPYSEVGTFTTLVRQVCWGRDRGKEGEEGGYVVWGI